jgi:hypothetical protein
VTRPRLVVWLALVGLLCGAVPIRASSGHTGHAKPATKAASKAAKPPKTAKPPKETKPKTSRAKASVPEPAGTTTRDARGRIQRSAAARHAFARQTGYPNGRPGYVIDHIRPLACGGADAPSNMQWQTVAAAKLKDRTERVGC